MRLMDMHPGTENVETLRGISSMAMRGVLVELTEAYEQRSGQRVALVSVGGVDAARRVENGEAFDFVVLAVETIERLELSGLVKLGSRTDLVRSGVAIAVPAGAPRPDVTSEAALRAAVLNARSIGYSTGPSGTHLIRLFERWGIRDAIASRIVKAPPGIPVCSLLAQGDVELGFQQLSELIHQPDIDVIGPLPPEVQVNTVFSGAVCASSNIPKSAGAFLSFLASPTANSSKRRHGMENLETGSGPDAFFPQPL